MFRECPSTGKHLMFRECPSTGHNVMFRVSKYRFKFFYPVGSQMMGYDLFLSRQSPTCIWVLFPCIQNMNYCSEISLEITDSIFQLIYILSRDFVGSTAVTILIRVSSPNPVRQAILNDKFALSIADLELLLNFTLLSGSTATNRSPLLLSGFSQLLQLTPSFCIEYPEVKTFMLLK